MPLGVTFSIAGEAAVGRTLATYSLDFGDGAASGELPFNGQATIVVTHTYETVGAFRAKLVVKDDAGTVSAAAEQTIEVGPPDAVFANGFE